jgi:hypothetical protein
MVAVILPKPVASSDSRSGFTVAVTTVRICWGYDCGLTPIICSMLSPPGGYGGQSLRKGSDSRPVARTQAERGVDDKAGGWRSTPVAKITYTLSSPCAFSFHRR